uniref:Uncharacterized protein LOC100378136 n=1 Tax=Saccoglossus kowalevskii TaxID=10224 RepID=A0ABM0GWY3_SACKO|nr:PREDICTED: uncharacterized protein LOC100378136 [Saccoglossus kowalevskii]
MTAKHVGGGAQMSDAFIEKTAKEKARLVHKLSNQLKTDMARLLEDTENADIILVCGGEHLLSHKIMLESRVPEFYNYFIGDQCTAKKIMMHCVLLDDLKAFLRDIYTLNEIITWRDTIKEWIKKQQLANTHVAADTEDMDVTLLTNGRDADVQMISQEMDAVPDDEVAMATTEDCNGNESGAFGEAVAMAVDVNSDVQLESGEKVASMEVGFQETEERFVNGKVATEIIVPAEYLEANMPEATCDLARDLLRMFVKQKATDIGLRVQGRLIKAHRFVLCCRSVYFTAMLCGGWAESTAEEIYLHDVSCSTALAALYYVYGGVMEHPNDANIGELVQMSDMYGLDGLKDNAAFILRRDKCHFFHKPCNICITGVPECLALSTAYGLHVISENCLRWITKHLDKVWSTKTFAVQSEEVLQHSFGYATSSLGLDNAVAMAMQCDKLLTSLPHVKWVEPVRCLATNLHTTCLDYLVKNFWEVVDHPTFAILLSASSWSHGLIEDLFNTIVQNLTVDNGCRMFVAANRLKGQSKFQDWNQDILNLVNSLHDGTRAYMVNNVNFLLHTKDWQLIPESLQNNIKQDALFVDDTKKSTIPKPTLSSSLMGPGRTGIPGIKRPSRLPTTLRSIKDKTSKITIADRPKTAPPAVRESRPQSPAVDKRTKEKRNLQQPRPSASSKVETKQDKKSTAMETRSLTRQASRPSSLPTKTMTVKPIEEKTKQTTQTARQQSRRPASASPTVQRSQRTTTTAIRSPLSPHMQRTTRDAFKTPLTLPVQKSARPSPVVKSPMLSPTEPLQNRIPSKTATWPRASTAKARSKNNSQNSKTDKLIKSNQKSMDTISTTKPKTPVSQRRSTDNTSLLISPQKERSFGFGFKASQEKERTQLSSPQKEHSFGFKATQEKEGKFKSPAVQYSSSGARPKIPSSPRNYGRKLAGLKSPNRVNEQPMEVEVSSQAVCEKTSYDMSEDIMQSPWRDETEPEMQLSRESSVYSSVSEQSSQELPLRHVSPQRQLCSPGQSASSLDSSETPAKIKKSGSWRRYTTDSEVSVTENITAWRKINQETEQKSVHGVSEVCESSNASSPGSTPGSPNRRLGARPKVRCGIPRPIKSPSPTLANKMYTSPAESNIPTKTFLRN